MILNEGLRAGDLDGLILPLVSIDEYESKLDDTAIVVAFFVQDQDPAQDLNRFIQKSAIDILDTDVSPAPNEDGYFLTFVEFQRDTKTPERVVELCHVLENLAKVDDWQFKAYRVNGIKDLTEENLNRYLRLKPKKDILTKDSNKKP